MIGDMIEKRFEELYDRAYERGIITFSDFLNMDEQSTLRSMYLPCELCGGYESAERVMAAFGDGIEKDIFPIECLKLEPTIAKFSDDLNHRDFLGALMNLGIKREMIGDIIVKDNTAFLFCSNKISQYILDNMERVKHTGIKASRISELPESVAPILEERTVICASLRVDAVVCGIYNMSRKQVLNLFKAEKVFVNSKITTNQSCTLNDGDIVSVRGFGKFIFNRVIKTTKKERLAISVSIYR